MHVNFSCEIPSVVLISKFQINFRFKREQSWTGITGTQYMPWTAILNGDPPNYVNGMNTGGLGPDPFFHPQGGLFEGRR
jgi:hypothetical protein